MLKAQILFRLAAHVASVIVVTLLLQFVWGEDFARVSAREWVGLSLFPFGVALGLAVAGWREGAGAMVAAASLAAFYLVYGLLLGGRVGGPWFIIFTSPAVLFFTSWALSKRPAKGAGEGAARA